jgi:hypothetical protein
VTALCASSTIISGRWICRRLANEIRVIASRASDQPNWRTAPAPLLAMATPAAVGDADEGPLPHCGARSLPRLAPASARRHIRAPWLHPMPRSRNPQACSAGNWALARP